MTGDLFSTVPHDPVFPPGLSYVPGFLTADMQASLLTQIDAMPWNCELQRRVQHYGYRYDYKTRRIDDSMYLGVLPRFACELTSLLERVPSYAQDSDQLIVNEYLPGQGISAHVDCETCFNDRVAAISLGGACEMELRELKTKRRVFVTLQPGSLLAMTGDARYRWSHQIRARLRDDGIPRRRRVSLTFRKVLCLA